MAYDTVIVTIVIPVFNAGRNLGRMLDSILAQSEQSFEVLCIDDGSNDDGETDAILEKYAALDSRITVFRQKNLGPAAARNAGLEKARGKYVYVCDHDDWLHSQLLEYCIWVLETKKVPFVAFKYINFGNDATPNPPLMDNFEKVPLTIVTEDSRRLAPDEYRRAHMFHADCWAQFATTELARKFPFAYDRSLTRPFALLKMAGRWAVSKAVLYYYNPGVATSMMHKPISIETMLAGRSDWLAFLDLYANERASGDRVGIWQQQVKDILIKNLKIELNEVRRLRQIENADTYNKKCAIFAETLREIFIKRKIPLRYASLKHIVRYVWLLAKFRNAQESCGKNLRAAPQI